MKRLLTTGLLLALSSSSFAVTLLSARLDNSKNEILVDVAYNGGCASHDFVLSVDRKTLKATLTDNTTDGCEAELLTQLRFPLADHGLNDPQYAGRTLTIFSADNSKSFAYVVLP